MPNAITTFILGVSLAASLISGCGTKPALDTSSPAPKTFRFPNQKTTPTHQTEDRKETTPNQIGRRSENFSSKTLFKEGRRWSAPTPASPEMPLRALKERLAKHPNAPNTDQVLLDVAKHEIRRGNLKAATTRLRRLQEKFPLSPLYPESVFYLGLTLQASGRHEDAWLSLNSSLSGESKPKRRALLQASLGEVHEKRGEAFPALLSYARAITSDPKIHQKTMLIRRIKTLARIVPPHQLHRIVERFGKSSVGTYIRSALTNRSGQEIRPQVGRVGIMLPLSGPAAAAGEHVYQGIQLALRHSLTKHPDLRIQLAVRDTRSAARSAGEAAEVAAGLIEKEKVIALIGPLLTRATELSAEIANRLQTPMLTPFSVRMDMKRDFQWVFRNSLTNRLQAQGVAVYAVQHLGVRRFAVLYPDNQDGRELTDAFTQTVERLGGEVVQIVSFPKNTTDFRAQMRALGGLDDRELTRKKLSLGLKKSDPFNVQLNFEALFVPAHHDKAVLIAPQLPFYNMREIQILGGSGWNSRRLLEHGESYVEGATFVDGFFADSKEPKIVRFVNAYKNLFGRKPGIFSALGYDAGQIIFTALAKGARTGAEVREHLAALKGFDGIMGLTDMGADNDARRQLFVLSVQGRKIQHLQMVAPHRTFRHREFKPIRSDGRLAPLPSKPAIP